MAQNVTIVIYNFPLLLALSCQLVAELQIQLNRIVYLLNLTNEVLPLETRLGPDPTAVQNDS